MTYRAVRHLMNELQQAPAPDAGKLSMMEILEQIEMPLVPVIADMQRNGVLLDVPYLADMSLRLDATVQALEEEIYQLGGRGKFNINSPKQLNDVLFENLKLSVQGLEKTQHGFSTDSASLALLKHAHPIIERIEEYRELTKLKGTYVDALPELVNPFTGRLHTSYNQTGTSTGRFSSSNPNLQNIPIRTEMGREVRRAFIAPNGYQLVAVDYSQIELRVMAHISDDATLIAAFEAGQDIHRATAAAVYGVPSQDVTDEMRGFAKRVNFGLMYGMGHFRLARESNLTVAEAEAFVKRYFQRIPGVERYLEETKLFAQQNGYVETLVGRRRYFPGLKDNRASQQRIGGEIRAAINMPIQGTAADILKIAMIRLHRELAASGLNARLILQVHDELVLEVEESVAQQVIALVLNVMQTAFPLKVPLVANAEVGANWRDMVPVSSV
jgi:DNA polymerase-1